MPMLKLDHVNIRTSNLTEMKSWYADVLELHAGARPDFPFDGAWLYCSEDPIVHLVEVEATPRGIEPRIEHFAISATGLPEFLERLSAREIAFSVDPVIGYPIVQVNIADHDGNHLHIDFSADEADGPT